MKKFTAIILSLIMAVSAFGAVIASAEDETAKHFYDEMAEYTVEGVIGSDPCTVRVDSEDDSYHCVGFSSASAGVYMISFEYSGNTDCCWDYICSTFSDDGQVETIKEQADTNEGTLCSFFPMEENETAYLFADFYGEGSVDISLSYVGEVSEISLTAPVVKESAVEIWTDEEEGITTSSFSYDLNVTFSNGVTVVVSEYYDEETDLTDAESVTVSGTVFGKEYTVEIPFTGVADVIESIELPVGFEPERCIMYSGETTVTYPEYITISFSDGTSGQYGINDGVLISEISDCEFIVDYGYDENGFYTEVAGFRAEFDVKTVRESFTQVLPQFFGNLSSQYKYGFDWLKNAIGNGDMNEITNAFTYIIFAFHRELTGMIDYLK